MASSPPSKRRLVRPSGDKPWDVQVISLVPESVHSMLTEAKGMHHGGWTVLATSSRLYVFSSRVCHCLYHPLLASSDILVSLAVSDANSSLHVFAAHPATGLLAVWILAETTNTTELLPRSPQAKVKVPLVAEERLSYLHARSTSMVVLGTTLGNVLEGNVSIRPVVVHVKPWTRAPSSLWSVVFGANDQPEEQSSPIVAVLSSKNNHWTVTESGLLEQWTDQENKPVASLTPFLQSYDSEFGSVLRVAVMGVSMLDQDNGFVCLDWVVRVTRKRQRRASRIYWLRTELQVYDRHLALRQAAFLNRFHDTVSCVALVTSDTGLAYAAFRYNDGQEYPVTLTCMGHNNNQHTSRDTLTMMEAIELDLPMNEIPSVVAAGKDVVTHGMVMVSSVGLVVRARWMQLQQQPRKSVLPVASISINTLANHLRTAFWHAYQHSLTSLHLPPSLQSVKTSDLEPAILSTAKQLEEHGEASSSRNPMEWHLAFLELIQQCGWYRRLSVSARWELLGMGQELAVHRALVGNSLMDQLEPCHVAKKLHQIQQHIFRYNLVDVPRWCAGLAKALEVAQQYREDRGPSTYDVFANPCHLWTHSAELQSVFRLQLQAYREGKADHDVAVVRAALLSFQETDDPDYENIQATAIPLIGNDAVAFEVSKEFGWYEGLCLLATKDPAFSLEPLLTGDYNRDFGPFVLEWFANRGEVARVFDYGAFVPNDLEDILARDDRLAPHRWIQAVERGDYSGASEALIQTSSVRTTRSAKAKDAQWSLSMAKLTCIIAETGTNEEEERSKRRKMIDAELDMIRAQEIISKESIALMPPEELLQTGLDKMPKSDNPLGLAAAGLAIALAQESESMAARVWCRVLQHDKEKWNHWMSLSLSRGMRETIIEETLFGALWELMQSQSVEHHSVQYDSHLEPAVLEQLGLDAVATTEMKRLLQAATRTQLETKSLVVSTIPT